MPTVSVIIPSYNHADYIEECLKSVFAQTFQDFEIIITDDASSDRTVEIIEGFEDPRIELFKHNTNRGASVASNNCIQHAKGKYIAMLSSDDAWYPNKLEVQVRYLESHPEIGAVFGKVDWIDETGANITSKHFPYMDVFDVKNRSRFEWLNHFFYKGNCLCHPCSLVRRECYDQVGLLDPSFASIPDFDLWIRICMKYEIHILDQRLIRFRRMDNGSNASGDTEENRVRNRYELRHTLNHYLNLTSVNEFNLTFPQAAVTGDFDKHVVYFLIAQLAIKSGMDYKVLWGLDIVHSILQEEAIAITLAEKFNFTYRDYIKLIGENDVFKVSTISSSLSFHPPVYQLGLLGTVMFLTKAYLKGIYKAIIKFITSR
jgi:glycosyltransferase involved in cell wall biosynthesis